MPAVRRSNHAEAKETPCAAQGQRVRGPGGQQEANAEIVGEQPQIQALQRQPFVTSPSCGPRRARPASESSIGCSADQVVHHVAERGLIHVEQRMRPIDPDD